MMKTGSKQRGVEFHKVAKLFRFVFFDNMMKILCYDYYAHSILYCSICGLQYDLCDGSQIKLG